MAEGSPGPEGAPGPPQSAGADGTPGARREGLARKASRAPSRARAAVERNLTGQVAEQLAEQIVAKLADDRPLLPIDGAARHLGVSRWTVYRLVNNGELKSVKVGTRLRFRPTDIDEYLNRLDAAS